MMQPILMIIQRVLAAVYAYTTCSATVNRALCLAIVMMVILPLAVWMTRVSVLAVIIVVLRCLEVGIGRSFRVFLALLKLTLKHLGELS